MEPQLPVHSVWIRDPYKMERQWFHEWYQNYALAIGVTSYRLVAGKLQQSCLTRSYALVLNVIVLVTLPGLLWASVVFVEDANFVPIHLTVTTYVFFLVSYVSIVSTVLSRSSRDSDSVKLHRIVYSLRRKCTHKTGRVLMYLFYFKFGTFTYLCLTNVVGCVFIPVLGSWTIAFKVFFINNAMNIPIIAIYRYFLSLWLISCCYECINSRIEDIANSVRAREPRKCELQEFQKLWILHSTLRGCIQRMNKDYSLPLLMGRFEFITFSVIKVYWGVLFSLAIKTPFYLKLFVYIQFLMHMIDFFLIDMMCDITVRYQNAPHDEVSEGFWYKQINSFLLYERTAKIKLWICGLYATDRRCWYKMMEFILNLCILLLQFHLITVHTLKEL